MAQDFLNMLREPFKIKDVEKRYPFTYEESMNSVLLQELARFNTLLERITSSTQTLIKTLQGRLVATAETESMLFCVLNNVVPASWKARSYPSLKPLLSYVKDL